MASPPCVAGNGSAQPRGTCVETVFPLAGVELADDLGQSGPSITAFARQYAGAASANPDWTWGVASSRLTATYDPAGELEIYYLLDASGRVTYVNSPLVSTMSGLLGAVARLAGNGHA